MGASATVTDDVLCDVIHTRLDALIAAIDRRIGAQLDEILHHPSFQRMERAWRGLAFVVERTDFAENIRVELLDCSKDDLARDLSRGEKPSAAGLYRLLYTDAVGRHTGEPYGAILADLEMGPDDGPLLERCARLAYACICPLLAMASPRLCGLASWSELAVSRVVPTDFVPPGFAALREREDARAVGLVMPRFLLRAAYEVNDPAFAYRESAEADEACCWGSATYAFATRLADSFARYRWCPNILGPTSGGLVADLPVRSALPSCTEIALGDAEERALAELGLIPLVACEGEAAACFYSAPSMQRPRSFGDSEEERAAEFNFRIGTQLPYFFILTRCLQYVSVMYYTRNDPEAPRAAIEKDLNDWIDQYVADRSVVTPAMRSRRPLRKARVVVSETATEDAWLALELKLRPHFKHMGAFFTLTITGKLDKPKAR